MVCARKTDSYTGLERRCLLKRSRQGNKVLLPADPDPIPEPVPGDSHDDPMNPSIDSFPMFKGSTITVKVGKNVEEEDDPALSYSHDEGRSAKVRQCLQNHGSGRSSHDNDQLSALDLDSESFGYYPKR